MLKNEKYILVDNENSLQQLVENLELYDMAALDTEADSLHHYHAKLCLIQITIGENHYIVDPLCGIDISSIFKTKAMKTLIFHGADYDLRLLWHTYQFSPQKIFDTMLASKILGKPHLGLADLVREYFGEELKKENQKADWSIRPLSLEMCEYAIHDTFFLHELCAILVEELKKMGRLNWLLEECDSLIEHTKQDGLQKKDPWRIKGGSAFSPYGLNLLKHIWEWREREAELLDRPPYKVMNNELIFAIIRSMERSYPRLIAKKLPKLPRNFKEDRLQRFINMLNRAKNLPESLWPVKKAKLAPPSIIPHSELMTAIKSWRDAEAENLNIDPSLLANKNQLIHLSVSGETPWETRFKRASFQKWQCEIWTKILQQNLKNLKS